MTKIEMSIDYQNPDRQDNQKEYTWTCPWVKCQHVVKSWTEGGLIALKSIHAETHWKDEADYARLNLTVEDRKLLKGLKVDPDKEGPERKSIWD